MSIFFRSPMCFRVPHLCSKIRKINNWSMELCYCINLSRPPGPYWIRPIQKLPNCQTRTRCRCCSIHPDWGATKNSAVALGSRNDMISIHQRSVRTNQGKTTLTRELCYEWFHHVRHHVHDGHWTGEFVTVISRLHYFTVTFSGDVRGESGPTELASINWITLQSGHVANLQELLYQTGSQNGVI